MQTLNPTKSEAYHQFVRQLVRGLDIELAIVNTEFTIGKQDDQTLEHFYFLAERLSESIQADLKYASDLYQHVSTDIDIVKWTIYRDFFLTKKYQKYLDQYLAVSTF